MTELAKRIAILLPDLKGGGVERVRLLLAEQFLAQGHDVDLVLVERRGELLAEVPLGCRVIGLDAPRLRSVPWRLRRYVLRERPDAMLAALWPLSCLTGMALQLARSSIPLIVSEHNDFRKAPAIRPAEKLMLGLLGPSLYRRASKVVAVSRGVRESLRDVAGLAEDSVEVIYNPIRQSGADDPGPADSELFRWWDAGTAKLVAVGSLKPQKDFATLLRALRLLRQDSDVRLIILGEGGERASLEWLIRAEGLGNAVRLPGFRKEPYPFFKHADLFVLSSQWEGLGNVITEALLCGCRVVSTDCPSGPAELLDGGRFGNLVPVADPQALAKAIAQSISTPHDPAPGIAWASRFSPAATAIAYLKLLWPHSSAVKPSEDTKELGGTRTVRNGAG